MSSFSASLRWRPAMAEAVEDKIPAVTQMVGTEQLTWCDGEAVAGPWDSPIKVESASIALFHWRLIALIVSQKLAISVTHRPHVDAVFFIVGDEALLLPDVHRSQDFNNRLL